MEAAAAIAVFAADCAAGAVGTVSDHQYAVGLLLRLQTPQLLQLLVLLIHRLFVCGAVGSWQLACLHRQRHLVQGEGFPGSMDAAGPPPQ